MTTLAVIRTKKPAVSARALKQAQREASDAALRHYQKHFIPLHFRRSAVNRYPEAYSGTVYLRRRSGDQTRTTDRVELRQFLTILRTKRPLVKTGLTERIASNAEHTFRGRADNRRMILRGLPRYFYQRRNHGPGRFDKVKALNAVSPAEGEVIIKRLDAHLTKLLKKR